MSQQYEVLVLRDRDLGGFWHLTPEIHDCVGWWPDGTPAWVDEPDHAQTHRIVLDVIPRRKPDGDHWLEDDPRVGRLIDIACTLNDTFSPHRGSVIADVNAAGDERAQSQAMLARIRTSFAPHETGEVLQLAREITQMRHSSIASHL